MSNVSVVVVTYNALPWLERCLESVRGVEAVVVDHGSTDGTVALVRERFPEVALVEQENRGLAFGWNAGVARTSGRYVLLLNSDAWLDDGSLSPTRTRPPPWSGRASAIPTGACSAPCAASRRCGGSPRSSSSCASSPRARGC
jgi:glycosyltransferase involved in cell wall biosynthesis